MLSSFACLACLSRFHKEVTRSYAQPGPSTGGETCWGREREEENARRESEKNSHRPLSIGERDYDVFRQEARMMIAENSEQMKTSIVARRITGSVSHAIFLCLPETTDATAIKTSNEAGIVNCPLCHFVQHLIKKKSSCVISLESAGVNTNLFASLPCQFDAELLHQAAPSLSEETLKDHLVLVVYVEPPTATLLVPSSPPHATSRTHLDTDSFFSSSFRPLSMFLFIFGSSYRFGFFILASLARNK